MEILHPLLEFIFFLIFTAIGWVYLFVKFRNFEKMKKEVREQHKGKYSNAGKMVGLNVLVAAGIGVIVAIWVLGIYWIINS